MVREPWYNLLIERRIMKRIKNNYTNFILTVIAIAMIGILFKGEINKTAYASSSYSTHCIGGYKFIISSTGSITPAFRVGGTGSPNREMTLPQKC